MTQKAKNTDPKTVEVPAFTEFTIAGHTVPVVAKFDDLPRATRRNLRDIARNATIQARGDADNLRYTKMLREYLVTYAASQGFLIDLDDETLPIEEQNRIDDDAWLIGARLRRHFEDMPGDEGKADGDSEPEA